MNKTSRRNFVKTAAASVATLPLVGSAIVESKPKGMKNVFVHQVYFWLKNPGNAADRAKLVEGLKTLTKIKHIKSWHIGIPAETDGIGNAALQVFHGQAPRPVGAVAEEIVDEGQVEAGGVGGNL